MEFGAEAIPGLTLLTLISITLLLVPPVTFFAFAFDPLPLFTISALAFFSVTFVTLPPVLLVSDALIFFLTPAPFLKVVHTFPGGQWQVD